MIAIVTCCDMQGRPYLKLNSAREGQMIETDDGFTCISEGKKIELFKDAIGLYFICEEGYHYIDGQADDGLHCIGLYEVKP